MCLYIAPCVASSVADSGILVARIVVSIRAKSGPLSGKGWEPSSQINRRLNVSMTSQFRFVNFTGRLLREGFKTALPDCTRSNYTARIRKSCACHIQGHDNLELRARQINDAAEAANMPARVSSCTRHIVLS